METCNVNNNINISYQHNLIIIDTSYYIFHRYYATLKWYIYYVQRKNTAFVNSDDENDVHNANDTNDTNDANETNQENKEGTEYTNAVTVDYNNLHKNEEFVGFFKKHFLQDLAKLKKKWSSISENILFCKDCSRDTIWRNDHHTNYKGTRVIGKTFNGEIFPVFYNIIATEYKWLCIPRLEADDIAYLIVNHLLPLSPYTTTNVLNCDFNKKIIIITNDNDYLQMRRPKLEIYNLIGNGVNLETRSKGTAEYDLLLKVIMGDVSDNILAIAPKIGPKTAAKLANMTENDRNAWIAAKGPACIAAYENNKLMVDFRNIPHVLQSEFYNKYKFKIV